jgi:hypothetical protein
VLLFLHEQLLARGLPLLRRDDRGCVHFNLLSGTCEWFLLVETPAAT